MAQVGDRDRDRRDYGKVWGGRGVWLLRREPACPL